MSLDTRLKKLEAIDTPVLGIRGLGERLRERRERRERRIAQAAPPRTLADWQRLAEGNTMVARIARRHLKRITGDYA